MNLNYSYVGCFFEYEKLKKAIADIQRVPLEKEIKFPHITFEYMPSFVDKSIFGEKIKVIIYGYGYDEENEGLKVRVSSENVVLNEMISKIEIPHITLSVSKNGSPVNTKKLNFTPIPEIEITGVYGGYSETKKCAVLAGQGCT